ncbi:hypothetical protein D7147_09625 [Micromonospora musae]|uniref:Uncharacterized protein n=1 Tax=Micromonospora musae TaxID=1894970 RepID=A0ABX9REV6_9ACTN|nr:hypothetical protein [Micromonospora musae]RKN21053.1 hypothetical protein D7147_09625 [Micromonospora musae]
MSRRTGRPSYLTTPRTRRPKPAVVAAAVAVALALGLLGGVIGFNVGRPTRVESTVDQLRRAEAERDVQQIIELTAAARGIGEQLTPILESIQQAAETGRTPEASQARQWQQTVRQLVETFADPPSGTTATNVARGSLKGAVEQTGVAVDTVALAVTKPVPARNEYLELAARQAALASTAWSVAATQLDQINIDSGQGHQHVHLGPGEADGAFAPDGAAEGSGGLTGR